MNEKVLDKVANMLSKLKRDKQVIQALSAALNTARVKRFVEFCESIKSEGIDYEGYTYNRTFYFYVNVLNLEGFTDPRLAGILTQLEFYNPSHVYMEEYAAQLRKDFNYIYDLPEYKYNEITLEVRVCVAACVKDDSQTCRRVVVGMLESKPEPIYKIVCDGQDDPTNEPAASTEATHD